MLGTWTVPGQTASRVLIAHRSEMMRRILRLNLESEGIATVQAATVRECVTWVRHHGVAAVVLDPQLLRNPRDEAAVCGVLQERRVPVLILSTEPDHRRIARALDGAPFCNRPDDVERVTAAVRALLAGAGLPTLV